MTIASAAKNIALVSGLWAAVILNAAGATPAVKIAQGPLFGSCGNVHPNMLSSGTIAGVSASSTKVSSDGTFMYQPGFDPASWSGSLKKLKLTMDDMSGAISIATTADWDAGDVLTGMDGKTTGPSPAARNVYTAQVKADRSVETVEFKWDKLAAAQKKLLDISPADHINDGLGEQRVNYLRGVRTLERGQPSGIFRARARVLGDIINSNPVYVGAPALTNGAGEIMPPAGRFSWREVLNWLELRAAANKK
jgi:Tfp pilus tip-associated adhesin PilY1